jgi:hypothetical protein
MASRPVRDWLAIKAAYVEGYEESGARVAEPTLDALQAKFGISISTLRKRSMKEKWADERQLFQARLEEAKREKSTEVLASKGAEFDALSLRSAEKLFKKIERELDAVLDGKSGASLTPNQIAALATAAKQAQHVGRLVMGDSTDNARLYAELLQKPDLSALSPAELEQLEALLGKARPAP